MQTKLGDSEEGIDREERAREEFEAVRDFVEHGKLATCPSGNQNCSRNLASNRQLPCPECEISDIRRLRRSR